MIGLIAMIRYVASVAATKLFGAHFPAWFGTLAESTFTMLTLFIAVVVNAMQREAAAS